MSANIEAEIKEIIGKQFNQDVENMKLDDLLEKTYGAKSHDIISMSAIIQGKYNIQIPYIESHSCKTVGDWVKVVEKKLNK